MSKILNIVKELFEDEIVAQKKNKEDGFKCFYDVSCQILRTGTDIASDEEKNDKVEVENTSTPALPTPQPVLKTESVKRKGKRKLILEDESFSFKEKGIISFSKDESENIHSLDDLLSSISNKPNSNGGKSFPEEVVAIFKIVLSPERQKISDFLKTEDKILCTIDYGSKVDESIVVKINKLSGSDYMSLLMRKDGSNLPDQFNPDTINDYIIVMKKDE
jgi:hypothetical protein